MVRSNDRAHVSETPSRPLVMAGADEV